MKVRLSLSESKDHPEKGDTKICDRKLNPSGTTNQGSGGTHSDSGLPRF